MLSTKVRLVSSKVAGENLDTSGRFREELLRRDEDDGLLVRTDHWSVVEPVILLSLDEEV